MASDLPGLRETRQGSSKTDIHHTIDPSRWHRKDRDVGEPQPFHRELEEGDPSAPNLDEAHSQGGAGDGHHDPRKSCAGAQVERVSIRGLERQDSPQRVEDMALPERGPVSLCHQAQRDRPIDQQELERQ